jgi:N6-adenosine-specific RNA methylase IME4
MKLLPRRISCTRQQAEARGALWVGAATNWATPYDGEGPAAARVALYRDFAASDSRKADWVRANLPTLRWRPLATDDPESAPSHADVLIELANPAALESHPAADIFPMMSEGERQALLADMRANGMLIGEEIVLLDGKVLDGRNRYINMMQLVGEGVFTPADQYVPGTSWHFVNFSTEDLDGTFDEATVERGPLAYVIAKNLHRRHLDESQRAMVAARLANMPAHRPAGKKSANLRTSQTEAATQLNIGVRSLQSAKAVQEKGAPEMVAAVDAGALPVSLAKKLVELPKEEQVRIVTADDKVPLARRARTEVSRHQRDIAEQQQGAKAAEWPEGKRYNIILVDVPRKWNARSDDTGSEKSPSNHYRTMTFEQQLDLAPKILALAAEDSMLVWWTTPASLLDDIEVMAECGFLALRPRDAQGRILRGPDSRPLPAIGGGRYSSEQVWRKVYPGEQTGMGLRFWGMHESILYGIRGKFVGPRKGEQPRSLFDAEVGEHSEKPRDIHRWVDIHYKNSTKIELFYRHDPLNPLPPGWDVFGDEAVQRAVREAAAVERPTAPMVAPDVEIEDIPGFLRRQA